MQPINQDRSMQENATPYGEKTAKSVNISGGHEESILFSSEKSRMDVSLSGIRNRTGVEVDELAVFVLKDVVDNALDFMDKNIHKTTNVFPEVKVFVTGEPKYIKIRVLNSGCSEKCK